MNPSVIKSLCEDVKRLLMAHAMIMICQWRKGAFTTEFLMTLLHYFIQNSILLIVLKNQMQLVYSANLAVGVFNFLAQ